MLNSWNKHDTDINVIESLLGYNIEGGKYVDGRYMFLVMLNKNYMLKRYVHTHIQYIYKLYGWKCREKGLKRSPPCYSDQEWGWAFEGGLGGMSSLGTLYILIHWNFPETLQS